MTDLVAMVYDVDTGLAGWVDRETQQWRELLDWCEFHQIDPKRIPVGTRIERYAGSCKIVYTRICTDTEGRREFDNDGRWIAQLVIEQGEAPPLPFPESIPMLPFSLFDSTRRP